MGTRKRITSEEIALSPADIALLLGATFNKSIEGMKIYVDADFVESLANQPRVGGRVGIDLEDQLEMFYVMTNTIEELEAVVRAENSVHGNKGE